MDSAECPQPETSPYSVLCDCIKGANQTAAAPNTASSIRPVPTPEIRASAFLKMAVSVVKTRTSPSNQEIYRFLVKLQATLLSL